MNKYEAYLAVNIPEGNARDHLTPVCLFCAITALEQAGNCDHIDYCRNEYGPQMLQQRYHSFYSASDQWTGLTPSHAPIQCGCTNE